MPITNIPTYEDYHIKATELIYDAFNELFNGNLEKSLASLHHSSELYLKSLICKESPYILINIHKSGLPQTGNKDFSDFYSMDAVDLPKMVTFLYGEEILQNMYNKNFKEIYNKIRKIRNKYIHSSESIDYCKKELLLDLLIVFNTFNKEKEFLFYFSKELEDWGNKKENEFSSHSELKKEIDNLDESESQEKLEYFVEKLGNYNNYLSKQCEIGIFLNNVSKFIFEKLEKKYKTIFFGLPEEYKNNDRMYACYKCTNNKRFQPKALNNGRNSGCINGYFGSFSQFNSLIKKDKSNFRCIACQSEYVLKEYKKCNCCSKHKKDEDLKTPFSKSFDGEFCLFCGCNEEENNKV